MNIKDIKIGDVVTNKRTMFPMKVVGIFDDGTLYLDFKDNEGDVWEENVKDVVKINRYDKKRTSEICSIDSEATRQFEKGFIDSTKRILDNMWHKIERDKTGQATKACLNKMYVYDAFIVYDMRYNEYSIVFREDPEWRDDIKLKWKYTFYLPFYRPVTQHVTIPKQ